MALANLPLACACGAVHWVAREVSASRDNHAVCYCDDCQAFAHALDCADRVLDANGGSEVLQISPARIEFRAGGERLACLRLRPKGLLRWHTSCCRTPVGNTLASRQVPFVGLVLRRADGEPERRARDAVLGPVRGAFHARFAVGDRSGLATHQGVPVALYARLFRMMVVGRLRGDHARSPFFTASGEPIAEPRVLTDDELAAARAPLALPTARG
jgi:Family of unknown function (DUF6151)